MGQTNIVPPGPEGLFVLANFFRILRNPLHFVTDWARRSVIEERQAAAGAQPITNGEPECAKMTATEQIA